MLLLLLPLPLLLLLPLLCSSALHICLVLQPLQHLPQRVGYCRKSRPLPRPPLLLALRPNVRCSSTDKPGGGCCRGGGGGGGGGGGRLQDQALRHECAQILADDRERVPRPLCRVPRPREAVEAEPSPLIIVAYNGEEERRAAADSCF